MEVPITNALITFCEENFSCEVGEPKAFMEFVRPDAEDPIDLDDIVRVIYHTYAIAAECFDDCEDWMVDKVLMPLTRAGGVRLYWRLEEKFQVETFEDSDECMLRTRIGVLDKDWAPIVIDGAVKMQGDEVRRIGDE